MRTGNMKFIWAVKRILTRQIRCCSERLLIPLLPTVQEPAWAQAPSAANREEEFEELLSYADDFVFNSPAQVKRYGARAKAAGKSIGLRVNPECSTQEGHEIYQSLRFWFQTWHDSG